MSAGSNANVVPLDLPAGQMAILRNAVEIAGGEVGASASAAAAETPAAREAVLSRLQSNRAMREHELVLTCTGLLGLLRVAGAEKGRVSREAALSSVNGRGWRISLEDLGCLVAEGYLIERGRWIEVTDLGNALVRALLVFARGWRAPSEF